jgi:hypothetical protein
VDGELLLGEMIVSGMPRLEPSAGVLALEGELRGDKVGRTIEEPPTEPVDLTLEAPVDRTVEDEAPEEVGWITVPGLPPVDAVRPDVTEDAALLVRDEVG